MSNPITQSYEMKASVTDVFESLTNSDVIQKWSGAPAKMDAQVGTEFSFFGGQIVGKNVEIIPNQKIVQDWREKTWEVDSKVTFILTEANDGTTVELIHENVPEASVESITQGWKDYYMGQIQKMFAG